MYILTQQCVYMYIAEYHYKVHISVYKYKGYHVCNVNYNRFMHVKYICVYMDVVCIYLYACSDAKV